MNRGVPVKDDCLEWGTGLILGGKDGTVIDEFERLNCTELRLPLVSEFADGYWLLIVFDTYIFDGETSVEPEPNGSF